MFNLNVIQKLYLHSQKMYKGAYNLLLLGLQRPFQNHLIYTSEFQFELGKVEAGTNALQWDSLHIYY